MILTDHLRLLEITLFDGLHNTSERALCLCIIILYYARVTDRQMDRQKSDLNCAEFITLRSLKM